jgi:hypothetical protein
MATQPMDSLTIPQRGFSPLAGLLSYLIPGLGQVVQGRIGKGILFFVCLYSLFFFGQYLGDWRNVYVFESALRPGQAERRSLLESVVDRARFFAQLWIGVAAWPAIIQNYSTAPTDKEHPWLGNYQRRPTEEELNKQIRDSDKSPDLGWVYTVIAGVLNILVIYDALAGPAHSPGSKLVIETGAKEQALA